MNRRQLLLGVAGAGVVGGALGSRYVTPNDNSGSDDAAPTTTSTVTAGLRSDPVGYGRVADRELPVPVEEMEQALPRDSIRSIMDPAFGPDWENVTATHFSGTEREFRTEPRLTDRDTVIGVARGGDARAYPLRVLSRHEIVNDTFDGPLLVTYCPVCASGIVAIREVRGVPTTFGVSGLLWKLNLVMYDRQTGSLWTQAEVTAINGESTGEQLELIPSSLTTWGAWREEYPDTEVLLPPPLSKPLYYGQPGMNRTGTYLRTPSWPPSSPGPAYFDRGPSTRVIGIRRGGEARAYPLPVVFEERVANDRVGGVPVVVTVAPGNSLVAYERTVRGRTLTFSPDDERHLQAGGSRWRSLTGEAVDGPFADESLRRATDVPQLYWETWKEFNPDTTVYGDYSFS